MLCVLNYLSKINVFIPYKRNDLNLKCSLNLYKIYEQIIYSLYACQILIHTYISLYHLCKYVLKYV